MKIHTLNWIAAATIVFLAGLQTIAQPKTQSNSIAQAQSMSSFASTPTQEQATTTSAPANTIVTTKSDPKLWHVHLNVTDVLLKGGGLILGRKVSPRLDIELSAGASRIDADEDESNSFTFLEDKSEHRLQKYGLRLNFTPFNVNTQNGLYLAVGAEHAKVKSEIKSEVLGITDSSFEREDDSTSAVLAVGWQFFGGSDSSQSVKISGRAGINYGPANKIEYNLAGTRYEVENSASFDANIGLSF